MHFFTEHTQLPSQTASDMKFGTNSNDPDLLFDLSTQFTLTTPAKAFACQDGQMIVQEFSAGSGLVNVIIKPID